LGRAILITALLAAITWPAGQASRTDGNIVLPEGAQLTDTELAGIQGTSAPVRFLTQLQQTCAGTPVTSAACGGVAAVGLLLLAAFHQESRDVIAEEFIRPWWEPLFAEPLRNCGPWGWKCWR